MDKKSQNKKQDPVFLSKEDVAPDALPNLLREARAQKKLNLRDLGELVGCSHVFLSKVERGLKTPSALLWAKLVEVLDIEKIVQFSQADHKGQLKPPLILPRSQTTRMPVTIGRPFAVALSALRDAGYAPVVREPNKKEKSDGVVVLLELKHDGEELITISFERNS